MKYIALLLLAVSAQAQAQDQVRFHFGDDPRWANPSFGDSAWPLVRPDVQTLPDLHSDGYSWFRYRLALPVTGEPLALRLAEAPAVFEVYIDGSRLGSRGTFPPSMTIRPAGAYNLSFPFTAGPAQEGKTALVAVRVWTPLNARERRGYAPQAEAGPRKQMELSNSLAYASELSQAIPEICVDLAIFLYGIAVYFMGRAFNKSPEILLFAFALVCHALAGLPGYLVLAREWDFIPFVLSERLLDFLYYVSFYCFCWRLFRLRWLYLALFVAAWSAIQWSQGAATLASTVSPAVELSRYWRWAELAGDGGFVLIAAWLFLRGAYSRPVMLTIALSFAAVILTIWGVLPYELVFGPVRMDTQTAVFLGVVVSMSWLLLGRAWRTWREQQGLSAEFEAAREMQESLVQRLPATPGFAVESAYRPASQVGGDFYRILHAGDDAILVVVGDVSGKGLKAAMTVSAIAGALDNEFSREPSEVLSHLNRALLQHKRGGFVTCCAALMLPNGEVRIANAGHLAPYSDGREVEVEAGLPLGVVADVEYPESLTTGDRFTFLSDGVLEAANAAHELFGFERSRQISIQPAAAIAQAAQTWGQNDDITVVTVRRTA
jgi:hypothetical protein